MNVLNTLKDLGGSAGGIAVYFGAKAVAELANITKERNKLKAGVKEKFAPLFPELDLDRVRIRPDCTLPANWFTSPNRIQAMTFGYTIYCKGQHMQSTPEKLDVLMHELFHVDQVRKRGDNEAQFAADYGKAFLNAGSYENNPMEVKADNFVTQHHFA